MRLSIRLLAPIAVAAIATPAQAQFFDRLLDRAERAVKGEIEGKVDREARKVTRCALGDATCIKAARSRGEEPEIVRRESGPKAYPVIDGDREIRFPMGERSFADAVVTYRPGDRRGLSRAVQGQGNVLGAPDGAGGAPCAARGDCPVVALAPGGEMVVRFTDNVLTGSGDDASDLWIFTGDAHSRLSVEVGVDGKTWEPVGSVHGPRGGVDIDAAGFGPYAAFSHVRLKNLPGDGISARPAVATIDAVGAISTRELGQ
ncbi:hypothetical protein GRI72_01760 [Altererythrobacter marinus]|uniref:Uncharacterized protein n=1 Tax=Pelagerythrobacter marinus TaxID=538382 RepID=A0ABW9URP1_9SPHN|nr:hypothetical protein [Pelagerythrobacter marinus]MXO67556.1 hypothetical protein [Pelagerythrobacter marinus]